MSPRFGEKFTYELSVEEQHGKSVCDPKQELADRQQEGGMAGLRNLDTPEGREFWSAVDQAVETWRRQRPAWSRQLEEGCMADDRAKEPLLQNSDFTLVYDGPAPLVDARVAALEAETQQLRESGRVNLAGKWAAEDKVARLEAELAHAQALQIPQAHVDCVADGCQKARLEAENAQLRQAIDRLSGAERERQIAEVMGDGSWLDKAAPPAPPGDQT